MASCILHVVQKHLAARGQPDTVVAHLEFLNRTEIGPTVFVVDEAKRGQRTIVHVTLYQHALDLDHAPWISPGRSRKEVVAYVTNTDLSRESGLTLPTGYTLPAPAPPPAPADLARLGREGQDEHWQRFRPGGDDVKKEGDYRAALGQSEFYVPRRGVVQRSVVDMWVRLATGERFTNMLLGFVADMWPYVVESYRTAVDADGQPLVDPGQVFWYPTLALSIDIKQALPPDGVEWLFLRVASKQIHNGRLDLEVVVLDAQERLVSLNHHVSLIMDASRNLSARSSL